jgi:hypothetical protein
LPSPFVDVRELTAREALSEGIVAPAAVICAGTACAAPVRGAGALCGAFENLVAAGR